MATLKAIRRRISSVKSTQQITRAMKLVAAARLRRAQEALQNATPVPRGARARRRFAARDASGPRSAPAEDAQREALVVVIGSDRGLCGGYNANLLRAAEDASRGVPSATGSQVKFFAVGRKALDHLRRAGHAVARSASDQQSRAWPPSDSRATSPRGCSSDYRGGGVSETGHHLQRIPLGDFRSGRPTNGCCR